jgi:hypothetical protein
VALRRRNKKALDEPTEVKSDATPEPAADGAGASGGPDAPNEAEGRSATADSSDGPLDASHPPRELPEGWGRIDLGALNLGVPAGVELRLDVDQGTGRVNAVVVVLEPLALQIMAYAAPKTLGIWDDVRAEIASSLAAQSGSAAEQQGRFGAELLATVPAEGGTVEARFLGVDGPRWFLRGVISGTGAHDDEASALAHDVFAATIIVRDDEARPSQEPLPVTVPRQSAPVPPDQADEVPGRTQVLSPFERGPEITEIR